MIHTNAIETLITTLPDAPIEVEETLLFKMRLLEAISPATASLAQRGYLGCLPFAHQKADEFVLRLLPGKNLSNSPIAVAWWSVTEALTIAPNLQRFLPGLMAYIDLAGKRISDSAKNHLLNFAAEFGDVSSTQVVLTALDEAQELKDAIERKAMLWAATGANEPLCQTISTAWQLEDKDALNWAQKAIQDNPELDIPWRIYVFCNLKFKTGVDLSDAAWRLIASDDVFDATYTGYSQGPRKGMWEGRPLIRAVQWLQKQENFELRTHPSLWKAVQAFADDSENYNGSEHLAAAQEIATENPVLAYTCAANAAAYYTYATELTPRSAIVFAHELAVANEWQELEIVLGWARNEMNL